MITRQPVQSTSVKSAGHDPATNELHVEFHSGRIYRFKDVSAEQCAALFGAESFGRHFNKHVRGQHAFEAIRESRDDGPRDEAASEEA